MGDKVVCDKDAAEEAVEEAAAAEAGNRIKNKNPTQRCGEKVASMLTAPFSISVRLQT